MTTLTRYTAKFYKDSSKIFYAVFISASENPITSVVETSEMYSYTVGSELLSDSSRKHILTFPKTTTGSGIVFFNITFTDGTVVTAFGQIPTDKQILVSPHDSLSFSTSFADFDSSSKTYSIADSVYYSKSPYKTLYVFPSSSTNYLDTSSTEDFYYTTAGSAAYIGSNDLQNNFLISNGHSVKGVTSTQLGKFIAGNGVQVLNFSQYTTAAKTGPVVHGYVYINTTNAPKGGITYNVSKNRASSNYYLNGCSDFTLPCRYDKTSFSNDCITGVTLTAAILNDSNNIFNDGGCAATCEGFSLKIANTRKASTKISADGVILAEVIGGLANYTFVLTAVEIGVHLSFSTVTSAGVTTATKEFTSLYAGEYTLKVTDSNTSACILTDTFIVTSESPEGTQKGCRQSGAVNYDSGVTAANGFDQLCVYCNSATGLLTQGVDLNNVERALGSFAHAKIQSQTNATSLSTTGASNNDGRVIINSLDLVGYNLGFSGKIEKFMFNSGDYFSDGTDFEYKLYTLALGPANEFEMNAAYLAANGTNTATQSNVNGAAMQFTTLAPADYAVKIYYTHDTQAKEYEDCYIIKQFSIFQEGCTDPDADNYNPLATVNDGSCFSSRSVTCALGNDLAVAEVHCQDYGGNCIEGNTWCFTAAALQIELPTYQQTSEAGGNMGQALAIAAGILNPHTGADATPDFCYYAIQYDYTSGPSIIISTAQNTFLHIGGYVGYQTNLNCDHIGLIGIRLIFTYGGNATGGVGGDNPAFSDQHYLNQGECTYEQQIPLPNAGDVFITCGEGCDVPPPVDDTEGCTDDTACNYNPDATQDSFDACDYTSCLVLGCTDVTATNYNPEATSDDESCVYAEWGCTDLTAPNYNPNANADDGSCEDIANDLCTQLTDYFAYTGLATYNFSSTTNCITVWNPDLEVCEGTAPFGTLTITLPQDLITAATDNTAVHWVGGVIQVASGLMRFNWTNNPYSAGTTNGNVGHLTTKFLELLGTEGEINPNLLSGDILAIDQSHAFTGIPASVPNYPNWGDPGMYMVLYYMWTDVNLTADGEAIFNLNAPCVSKTYTTTIGAAPVCQGAPGTYLGCTDMAADNYDSLATDDDGTCEYPQGCTDPLASNYNSNIMFDDGSCVYVLPACSPPTPQACTPNLYIAPTAASEDSVTSCCIPHDISMRLAAIEKCLTTSGSRFYNKMITGLSDTCSTMDAWKMVLILEILRKKGLPCVYNCSDQNTPDLQNTTCDGVWQAQGSNMWHNTGIYQVGSVVKSIANYNYYVALNGVGLDLSPNTTVSNSTNPLSGWSRCCDEASYSGTINYLTRFLSFVEKYCKDCEIPPYTQVTSLIPPSVDTTLTVGGLNIENNGTPFEG